MKNGPFVSIIMPTLNEGAWIEDSLRSVKQQDYDNYEIIIVDGYSQDRTRKIARKYSNKIILREKKGPGDARNIGAKNAKGEILVFLDADTSIDSTAIKKLIKEFDDESVVCCGIEIKSSKNDFSSAILLKLFYLVTQFLMKINRPALGGSFIACRKNVFKKINGFDIKLISAEDMNFVYKMRGFGKVRYVNSYCRTDPRRLEKIGFIRLIIFGSYLIPKFIFDGKAELKNYWKY